MKYLAAIDYAALENISAKNFANQTPGKIISDLFIYIYPLGGLIVLIMLISAGYQYMTSMGDPKGIAAAQQKITWAIIGFIVLFLAYWITSFIGSALGIERITDIFK